MLHPTAIGSRAAAPTTRPRHRSARQNWSSPASPRCLTSVKRTTTLSTIIPPGPLARPLIFILARWRGPLSSYFHARVVVATRSKGVLPWKLHDFVPRRPDL